MIREGRKKGALLFVNISNDGWFPQSRLALEHFNLSRVRAVENGVFVLRSCNTGITAIVDPFGKIVASLRERDTKNQLLSEVQVAKLSCFSRATGFAKYGNSPLIFFCFLYVILNLLINKNLLK